MPRTMTPPNGILPAGSKNRTPEAGWMDEKKPTAEPAKAPPMATPPAAESKTKPTAEPSLFSDDAPATEAAPATAQSPPVAPESPTLDDPRPESGKLSLAVARADIAADESVPEGRCKISIAELTEERKLLDSLYFHACEVAELEKQEATIMAELGAVQKQLHDAREGRGNFIAALPGKLIEMRESNPNFTRPPAPVRKFADATLETEPTDESWKEIPTSLMLDKIRGLGETRLGKIADEYPTAGDLETARAAAYRDRKNFSTVLPKGTGKGAASAIEERLLDVVAGKWTSPDSVPVKKESSRKKVETDVDLDPIIETAGDHTPHSRAVRSTGRSIAATATPESIGPDGSGEWTAGHNSNLADCPIDDCPEGLELHAESTWIKGWMYGHLYGPLPTSEPETEPKPEPSPEAEMLAESVRLGDDSGIDPKLVEWVNKETRDIAASFFDGSYQNLSPEAADQLRDGMECFDTGESLTEIPAEIERNGKWEPSTTEERFSWVLGWMTAMAQAKKIIPTLDDEPAAGTIAESDNRTTEETPDPNEADVPEPESFEAIAERIKQSDDRDCVSDNDAWNAGYGDGMGDSPGITDPGGSSESREDYLRGYYSAADLFSGL